MRIAATSALMSVNHASLLRGNSLSESKSHPGADDVQHF